MDKKPTTTKMRVNLGCYAIDDNGHRLGEGDTFETTDVKRHGQNAQLATLPWPAVTVEDPKKKNTPSE